MNTEQFTINIEDIENAPSNTLQINFEEYLNEVKSTEPIKADLTLTSLGEFIEITGTVQGTALLECDLCLEEFEHKIDFEIDELFAKNALQDDYAQETEIKEEQFVTDLNGSESIDIYDLLYQSVILDFPNKKVCGINCKGGDIFIRDDNSTQMEQDPRMSVFKSIKVNGK
jgi:uncharacterized protein